jgi:hypothetical protein
MWSVDVGPASCVGGGLALRNEVVEVRESGLWVRERCERSASRTSIASILLIVVVFVSSVGIVHLFLVIIIILNSPFLVSLPVLLIQAPNPRLGFRVSLRHRITDGNRPFKRVHLALFLARFKCFFAVVCSA